MPYGFCLGRNGNPLSVAWWLLWALQNVHRRGLGRGYGLEVRSHLARHIQPLTRCSYVFQWLVTLPLELVASSITLQYWEQPLHHAVWVTIFLFGIVVINIFGVKGYADVEATLSVMKVVAIVGFM
jgi:amino acid transporter